MDNKANAYRPEPQLDQNLFNKYSKVTRAEPDSGTIRSYQQATISRRIKDTTPVAPADRTKPKARRTYMDSY